MKTQRNEYVSFDALENEFRDQEKEDMIEPAEQNILQGEKKIDFDHEKRKVKIKRGTNLNEILQIKEDYPSYKICFSL